MEGKMEESEGEGGHAPLLDHLKELRTRLLWVVVSGVLIFFVSFWFASYIFDILVWPLKDIWGDESGRRLIYTALHEKFFTEVKLSFFVSLLLVLPMGLFQLWKFVAPGLYRNEKRAFFPFLAATPILFCVGVLFVYFSVLPVAWKFFLGFEQAATDESLAIALEPKVGEYLSLVMQLMFAFGLSFELPVGLVLLVTAGIVSVDSLKRKRRYAVVLSFVVAAILTPPDPLSQVGLALPLIFLYELSIWVGRLVEKSRERRRFAREEERRDA
jgi:sec-independent protein translocase protein TatC